MDTEITETTEMGKENASVLPLLLTRRQAAKLLGYHVRTFDRLSRTARFPGPVRPLGRGTYPHWRRDDILKWVRNLRG